MKAKAQSRRVTKMARRKVSLAKQRARAEVIINAERCSYSSDESDTLNDGEGVGGERRDHHNELERIRRDHLKGSFDGLIEVCPGLKGMNSLACRGEVLRKSANFIEKWSKYFDPSEEGQTLFKEKFKFMNDFCEEMENVVRTGSVTETYEKMKEHFENYKAEYAMFTRKSFATKLCKGLDVATKNLSHQYSEDEGEQNDDGDIDVGEDDFGDDEDTNENDEDSNEEDNEDGYSDTAEEGEEDETEANREDEDQDISEETDEGVELADDENQEYSTDQQEYQENYDDDEDEEVNVV
ncbi:protein PFC0760c-like isoform X2 [Cloeon dipterum]